MRTTLNIALRKGESIHIDGESEVKFERGCKDGRVRLSVHADRETNVKRTDTFDAPNSKKEIQSK